MSGKDVKKRKRFHAGDWMILTTVPLMLGLAWATGSFPVALVAAAVLGAGNLLAVWTVADWREVALQRRHITEGCFRLLEMAAEKSALERDQAGRKEAMLLAEIDDLKSRLKDKS